MMMKKKGERLVRERESVCVCFIWVFMFWISWFKENFVEGDLGKQKEYLG